MAHVVNVSSRIFPLEIGTQAGKKPLRFEMKPGDVVEVDDAYGFRRQPNPAADPMPSIVELLSNGCIVPSSDPRAAEHFAAWEAARNPQPATAAPTAGVDTPIRSSGQSQSKGR